MLSGYKSFAGEADVEHLEHTLVRLKRRLPLGEGDALDQYIKTGNPAALAKIPRQASQGYHWVWELSRLLRRPAEWTDADRRIVHLIGLRTDGEYLWDWVDAELRQQREEDVLGMVIGELKSVGVSRDDAAVGILRFVGNLLHKGQPTSAGRLLLSLSNEELTAAIGRAGQLTASWRVNGFSAVTELLALAAPDRLDALVNQLLETRAQGRQLIEVVRTLIEHTGERFLPQILTAHQNNKDLWQGFLVTQQLYKLDPARFSDLAFDAACAEIHRGSRSPHDPGVWLVTTFGERAVPDLKAYFGSGRATAHWGNAILDAAAKLGGKAIPIFLAALDGASVPDTAADTANLNELAKASRAKDRLRLRQRALQHLIALGEAFTEGRIERELRAGLTEADAQMVIEFLNLVSRWKPQPLEGDVWGLLQHKSRPVRSAAARTLGKLGDAAIPKARELLRNKKADVRSAAVSLLAAAGSDAALAELEARLDEETSDDVRDQMLMALTAAWAKQGRTPGRQEVEARIAKTAPKLVEPLAPWADPSTLPPLFWKDDGSPLSRDAVAYLLYRQSRTARMEADVELAPMYGLIDRSRSGPFAQAVLRGFVASRQDAADRWALAVAGMLGDDRLVPDLAAQIRDWVDHSRGKLAEYGVQALALLGTDAALLAVDAMAIRYRSRMKNVGRAAAEAFIEAAAAQGVTPEELGDRVVPWLGFEPGKPRIIALGKSRIEASIGLDFRLSLKDLDKNKPVKSLPKSAPAQLLAEFKDLSANLREVTKAQMLRLENLLVRQRRWPAPTWRQLFLHHPLLLPFAVRLAWGSYDAQGRRVGLFRALADRSLTTHADEPFDLPESGSVGMIHPLELTDAERSAWQNHLADYEIEPPFPQLEREVVRCAPEQAAQRMYRDLSGTALNAMTFKGRAEKLGWYRGSVCDGGGITSYYKSFPASGADAFLALEDFYIGIDMYSEMKLGDACFVRNGSVRVGSYTYDEPGKEDDPRLIPLGQVPPIVFSEVMGDLRKIAGGAGGPAEGE